MQSANNKKSNSSTVKRDLLKKDTKKLKAKRNYIRYFFPLIQTFNSFMYFFNH